MRRIALSFLATWLPLLLWMAMIFWLSDQPKLPHPLRKRGVSDDLFDYAAHGFTFGVLTVLTWRAATSWRTRWCQPWGVNRVPLCAAWAALYALSDELHQRFVPGRWSSGKDLLADMAGVAAATLLLAVWLLLRDRLLAWIWRWAASTRAGTWLARRMDVSACLWAQACANWPCDEAQDAAAAD